MTGVIGYARTFLHGGDFEPPRLGSFAEEIARFHETLSSLSDDFADPTLTARITDEQFLQGPLADAMTHAGQLAMLRRLHGSPVPSENFIFAKVSGANRHAALRHCLPLLTKIGVPKILRSRLGRAGRQSLNGATMPFKSKAQRRKFAELLVKGEISPETYEEWNRETGRKVLPERVKKKARRKKATRKAKKAARRARKK